MTNLIKKPFELTVNPYIKVLLYGSPGIGKTTFALSTPAPLMLDFDGGIHRIKPEHQTDTVQITCWMDAENVLLQDLSAYKTLVVDTAGKMLDYISEDIVKNDSKLGKRDGSLSLQGYGVRKVRFINFLKQVALMKKHIVFVAHEKEEKDGDTRFIRPDIGGSSGGDMIKELDLVGYMEAVGKDRTISFDPTEKYYGKNTCELPSLIKLPNLAEGVKNETLSKIFETYIASLESRKEKAGEYQDLLELIAGNLEDVKDAETANGFMEWAKSAVTIWDSKLQASVGLQKKAKELNLTFDNKSKSYHDHEKASV